MKTPATFDSLSLALEALGVNLSRLRKNIAEAEEACDLACAASAAGPEQIVAEAATPAVVTTVDRASGDRPVHGGVALQRDALRGEGRGAVLDGRALLCPGRILAMRQTMRGRDDVTTTTLAVRANPNPPVVQRGAQAA